MNNDKFKNSRTKEVTLSTGDKIKVSAINLGTLEKITPHVVGPSDLLKPDFQGAAFQSMMRCQRIIAVDCGHSEEFPLVNKPVAECKTGEISADVLLVEDLAAISKAAMELSTGK